MKSQYDYELIRDYIFGLTDAQTTREIGELIRQDEIARTIAEGILRLEKNFEGNEDDVNAYLDTFLQSQLQTIQKQTGDTHRRRIWLRVAASVLLVAIAGYVITIMLRPSADTLIAQELSQPYAVSNLVRSDGNTSDEERGYAAYTNGNYVEAMGHFGKATAVDPKSGSIAFYFALSNLYAGRYQDAVTLFESKSIAESRYEQQARWYKGIALIRSGNKEKAREIFQSVAEDDGHFKRAEAQQLLSLLE
jgi:tetratricopeptide (TPR) repeat protein